MVSVVQGPWIAHVQGNPASEQDCSSMSNYRCHIWPCYLLNLRNDVCCACCVPLWAVVWYHMRLTDGTESCDSRGTAPCTTHRTCDRKCWPITGQACWCIEHPAAWQTSVPLAASCCSDFLLPWSCADFDVYMVFGHAASTFCSGQAGDWH
jgi:hypothetical protein